MWLLQGHSQPITTLVLPAPQDIVEMVRCQCKTDCCMLRCSCQCNNLPCTEICLCGTDNECTNNALETMTVTVSIIKDNLLISLNKLCLL